ncbi:signal peptidase I [Gryllotalpicola ginsengisoli]|uniref:signal peptidase I n=1 Tax=Gryllotalpicola ginsengisoli TaxID=444608 RepID=UPI0003B6AD05|nr:signal peptidase I [Gryllotalpicola ginsengisoli]
MTTRPATAAVAVLREVAVTTIGVLGAATVLWLVASWIFALHLTVLVTGSMAPTMPTGTLAVTHVVPAQQLRVGDVVTVPRAHDGAPVTHRIVEIEAGATADERMLRLKGDDNASRDTQTYVVHETPRVVASVPGVGAVLLWARTPVVSVTGVVLLALIVAWGLWPTAPRRGRAPARVLARG